MIKQIILIGSKKHFLHHCSCGKKWVEPEPKSPKKPNSPPYNYCSICGKWLGFFSYLQFWEKIKVCSKCEKELKD